MNEWINISLKYYLRSLVHFVCRSCCCCCFISCSTIQMCKIHLLTKSKKKTKKINKFPVDIIICPSSTPSHFLFCFLLNSNVLFCSFLFCSSTILFIYTKRKRTFNRDKLYYIEFTRVQQNTIGHTKQSSVLSSFRKLIVSTFNISGMCRL